MTEHEELLRRVKSENLGRCLFWPCCLFLGIIAVALIAAFITSICCDPVNKYTWSKFILWACSLTAFLAFFAARYHFHESLRASAAAIDAKHRSKSRMESSIEMMDKDEPLKMLQMHQTWKFFQNIKPANWRLRFGLLGIAAVLLLSAYVPFLKFQAVQADKAVADSVNMGKNAVAAAADKEAAKQKTPDVLAELNLTAPESEMRARPMDEISWEGTGYSTIGFDDLSMAIAVNGRHMTNIAIDAAISNKSADISFSGAFNLDELDVVPFDVVSYNISGHWTSNAVRKEVVSTPQFIEVRPFREDAEFLRLQDMDLVELTPEELKIVLQMLSSMSKILRFQIGLNKAVFVAKASCLNIDNPVFGEQIKQLSAEQLILLKEVTDIIEKTPAEFLSPNMLDCLQQASSFMKSAGDVLNKLSKRAPAAAESKPDNKGGPK